MRMVKYTDLAEDGYLDRRLRELTGCIILAVCTDFGHQPVFAASHVHLWYSVLSTLLMHWTDDCINASR